MVISGVVIETLPGRVSAVAERLASVDGLEITADDGNSRLAAVWRASDASRLEKEAERLVRAESDILGIYPTFVGKE